MMSGPGYTNQPTGGGGSSTGTSTPSTPPAGSSGGGGASAPSASAKEAKRRQQASLLASFSLMLSQWGMNPSEKNLAHLIHNASQQLWSSDQFIMALTKTKEFHKSFPGIFGPGGHLAMDPSTYISNRNAIQTAAKTWGVNLNRKQLDRMMVNHVNPGIASQRFQVESTILTNKNSFDAWNVELKSQGKRPMSKADLTRFLLGQSASTVYTDYTRWQTRMTAQASGFAVEAEPTKTVGTGKHRRKVPTGQPAGIYENGRLTDQQNFLTTGEKNYVANQLNLGREGAGGLTPAAAAGNLANLAHDFRTSFPESQRQGMGISHDDLVQLEFGGPRQAAVQAKVEQIMSNTRAESSQQFGSAGHYGELHRNG